MGINGEPSIVSRAIVATMMFEASQSRIKITEGELKLLLRAAVLGFLPEPPIRCLHVGCDDGRLLIALSEDEELLGDFSGVDCREKVEKARRNAQSNGSKVTFYESLLWDFSIKIPRAAFNLVLVTGLGSAPQEHRLSVLTEAAKSLVEYGAFAAIYFERNGGLTLGRSFIELLKYGVGVDITTISLGDGLTLVALCGKKKSHLAQVFLRANEESSTRAGP